MSPSPRFPMLTDHSYTYLTEPLFELEQIYSMRYMKHLNLKKYAYYIFFVFSLNFVLS